MVATGLLIQGVSWLGGASAKAYQNHTADITKQQVAAMQQYSKGAPRVLYHSLKRRVGENVFFQPRLRTGSPVEFRAEVDEFQYVAARKDPRGVRLYEVVLECSVELKKGSSKTYFKGKYKGHSSACYSAASYACDPGLVEAASQQAIDGMMQSFAEDLAKKTQVE